MIIINESRNLKESNVIEITDTDFNTVLRKVKDLDDGAVVVDSKNPKITYHKASNGVKSGWGERHNGQRVNIRLWTDDQVAKSLVASNKS